MPLTKTDHGIVEKLFKAMQAGPAGESDMMRLFADRAVFIEPFSGQARTHTGKEQIRRSFQGMWADPVPDLQLTLTRVDAAGQQVRAEWSCTSPVFPAPMKGYDLFDIKNGLIERLEIVVTDAPPMPPHAG